MNYQNALKFLDSFLNLEKLSQFPSNPFFNLKRMEHLLQVGGQPQKNFLPILIAGTTGKGSTGFFLESILRANNVKVGYYHSPHIEDVRERIRIDGEMVSKVLWAEGLSRIRGFLIKNPLPKKLGSLTYFEIMTFLAMLLFSKAKEQVGIFEVGLGGRLDATNVLKAPMVILTPIHLDHEHFLGNTIAKITAEKAGIIKKKCQVVTAPQSSEALKVIKKTVQKNYTQLYQAQPARGVSLSLEGDFQKVNAGTAIKAVEVLSKFGIPIAKEAYSKAFRMEGWPGRMERVHKYGRNFILDGAHNPFSIKSLTMSLRETCFLLSQESSRDRGNLTQSVIPERINRESMEPRRVPGSAEPRAQKGRWVIFGAMQDKNSKAILAPLARQFDKIIITQISNNRAKSVGTLIKEAKNLFKCVLPAHNVSEALRFFKNASRPGDSILVTGSFYLVGEVRKFLK